MILAVAVAHSTPNIRGADTLTARLPTLKPRHREPYIGLDGPIAGLLHPVHIDLAVCIATQLWRHSSVRWRQTLKEQALT